MSWTPIWDMAEPMGPMEKGMTYMVRPRMEPLKSCLSFLRMTKGFSQLLVGPAFSLEREQMKVRSSTRATSLGLERA